MTKDVGLHGRLFGGNMMAWADEAAAIYAQVETNYDLVVTRKIGEINFTKPVKVGDVIHFMGSDPKHTDCSISFDLTVINAKTGEVYFTTDFVFVAVDKHGKKCNIPGRKSNI